MSRHTVDEAIGGAMSDHPLVIASAASFSATPESGATPESDVTPDGILGGISDIRPPRITVIDAFALPFGHGGTDLEAGLALAMSLFDPAPSISANRNHVDEALGGAHDQPSGAITVLVIDLDGDLGDLPNLDALLDDEFTRHQLFRDLAARIFDGANPIAADALLFSGGCACGSADCTSAPALASTLTAPLEASTVAAPTLASMTCDDASCAGNCAGTCSATGSGNPEAKATPAGCPCGNSGCKSTAAIISPERMSGFVAGSEGN